MRIFYDTEFTGLGQQNPDLISAGFVTEDGQEFYAEIADFEPRKCAQWVRETVLPLLDAPQRLPLVEFGEKLATWLESFGDVSIHLVSDAEVDGRLVMAALGERLAAMPCTVFPILTRTESFETLEAEYRFWQQPENRGREHHALYDARCLRLMRLALENEVRQHVKAKK